jgi:glutathione synthase/RimK-type ligase-like ATP-grasp enzyme
LSLFDITLLTEDRYEAPESITPYIKNVLTEDRLLLTALENKGLKVDRKSWSAKNHDWTDTQFAIFRSTWDYFERLDEFIRWMGRASRTTRLINEFRLAQWNLDKHYLLDLEQNGIPIVPTIFIKPHERTTLMDEILKSNLINGAVLKPSISGAARHTYRLKAHNIENHEAIFQRLIKTESLMLQPFLENIIEKGEISLMVINGKYTHAVLKKAKFGDFRVQDDFGGTVHEYLPTEEEIQLAESAVAACPYHALYARVDMVWNNDNQLVLSELELIEPELFFRNNPSSADLLATAIVKHMETPQTS